MVYTNSNSNQKNKFKQQKHKLYSSIVREDSNKDNKINDKQTGFIYFSWRVTTKFIVFTNVKHLLWPDSLKKKDNLIYTMKICTNTSENV